MADQTQTKKIKCPHCGWVRTITIHINAGKVEVVAGPEQLVSDLRERIRNLFIDQELENANAWIVMKPCPKVGCEKTYEYNLRTGETRK